MQDFGDLQLQDFGFWCFHRTSGLFGGGYMLPQTNRIDYVTIASTGNAKDFGDLTVTSARRWKLCSNSTPRIF